MRAWLLICACAVALFALPAVAGADSPTAATAGATGATGPTAPVKPSKPAAFSLGVSGTYVYKHRRYALPTTKLTIKGSVKADLDNQIVAVVIKKHGRTVHTDNVRLSGNSSSASFSTTWKIGSKGAYTISVDVPSGLAGYATSGGDVIVKSVRTDIHSGSSGVAVRVFQAKLAALGYVTPRNGNFNDATGRAFMAFRKVNDMARNFSAGSKVAHKLASGKGGFHLRYPGAGRHVEVSIKKQVMAFADHGKVVRIYHVSTGKPSTPTVRGTFHVYRKDWGTNEKGMVDSNYFTGGYAIHGYAEVPSYNASHGCVRVPIPNAASIYAWVHMGTRVDVYY